MPHELHSFSKYLLSARDMPGSVLGTRAQHGLSWSSYSSGRSHAVRDEDGPREGQPGHGGRV